MDGGSTHRPTGTRSSPTQRRASLTRRELSAIKFHENFNITTVQPYAEFQLVSIPRVTITAGIRDGFFRMWLKQFAERKNSRQSLHSWRIGPELPRLGDACRKLQLLVPSFEANVRILNNWSVYGQYGWQHHSFQRWFDVTGAQVVAPPPSTIASTYQGGTVLKLNHLSVDGDVFHIHFVNQYSSFTPSSGADAGFTFYYATPPSNTNGVEAEGNLYLARGLSLFMNGTFGEAKYEASSGTAATATAPAVPASPAAWVALAPHDTESAGITYQKSAWDVGFFNKRVGTRWNDDGAFHQVVPLDAFWMNNLFVNYTIRSESRFDQSKIKLSFNNLFDNHDVVTIGPANSVSNSLVTYAPSPLDTLQLLPGRSVMATFQLGFSPRKH